MFSGSRGTCTDEASDSALRTTVRLVARLNLIWCAIAFVVARSIGSVALFADSIEMLEEATINALLERATLCVARHAAGPGNRDGLDRLSQTGRILWCPMPRCCR